MQVAIYVSHRSPHFLLYIIVLLVCFLFFILYHLGFPFKRKDSLNYLNCPQNSSHQMDFFLTELRESLQYI